MPSGHSVESMLISVFLVMYIIKNHEKSMKRNILIILVLVIGMSVCISRVVLGCHTVLQIIIGGIIGSVIGYDLKTPLISGVISFRRINFIYYIGIYKLIEN